MDKCIWFFTPTQHVKHVVSLKLSVLFYKSRGAQSCHTYWNWIPLLIYVVLSLSQSMVRMAENLSWDMLKGDGLLTSSSTIHFQIILTLKNYGLENSDLRKDDMFPFWKLVTHPWQPESVTLHISLPLFLTQLWDLKSLKCFKWRDMWIYLQ